MAPGFARVLKTASLQVAFRKERGNFFPRHPEECSQPHILQPSSGPCSQSSSQDWEDKMECKSRAIPLMHGGVSKGWNIWLLLLQGNMPGGASGKELACQCKKLA